MKRIVVLMISFIVVATLSSCDESFIQSTSSETESTFINPYQSFAPASAEDVSIASEDIGGLQDPEKYDPNARC